MARNVYDDYYLRQAGDGMPVFIGGLHQRGRGLGNILGGLARMVVPILKRGGKTLLKEGVRTGMNILSDVASGTNIKASARRRVGQSGNRLLKKAVSSVSPAPPGRPVTKRKRKASHPRTKTTKRTKRRKTNDIFG